MTANERPQSPDAPFPYFGGKRRIAPVVWAALGADVANYVESFLGSAAVLLADRRWPLFAQAGQTEPAP